MTSRTMSPMSLCSSQSWRNLMDLQHALLTCAQHSVVQKVMCPKLYAA